MIRKCRNEFNEIGKKNRVFIIWVPGHSGIKGNEEANTSAKKGARIGPEPFCGIGKCTLAKEGERMLLIGPEPFCAISTYKKEEADMEKLWRNLPGMDHSIEFLWNFETASFKRNLDLGKKE